MKTGFGEAPAPFVSASQSARFETEGWADQNMFCPSCSNSSLARFPANRPVADLFCENCGDEYELKSQSKAFGRRVANGAYSAKLQRLKENNSPNLILLQYDRIEREVVNLRIVPRFFFSTSVVEKRRPLGPNARRAGWVGSNILLDRIPQSGQISVIENGIIVDRSIVIEAWRRLKFIDGKTGSARGWLLDVLRCVESVRDTEFMLEELYAFEGQLKTLYPMNNNVRPKIRQQLQVLRDNGVIEFLGRGRYSKRLTA